VEVSIAQVVTAFFEISKEQYFDFKTFWHLEAYGFELTGCRFSHVVGGQTLEIFHKLQASVSGGSFRSTGPLIPQKTAAKY